MVRSTRLKNWLHLVVQNANNDITTELNLAQTDIQNKPACLILDPVDSNGIVTAM